MNKLYKELEQLYEAFNTEEAKIKQSILVLQQACVHPSVAVEHTKGTSYSTEGYISDPTYHKNTYRCNLCGFEQDEEYYTSSYNGRKYDIKNTDRYIC